MSGNRPGNAFLTGAAGGIGEAIAAALVRDGYRVVLADRDEASVIALAQQLGSTAYPLVLDITDNARVERLPELIPEAWRPIDTLINNAGHDIGGRTRFDLGSADDWAAIVETNLLGLMRVTRALIPEMIKRNTGDIVVMSSINAIRLVPTMAPYSASKAGVHMLTEVLRGDLAQTGIRVIEINPGLTRTKIIASRHRGDEAKAKEFYDKFGMALEADDIARSVKFALNQPRSVQVAQMVILPLDKH